MLESLLFTRLVGSLVACAIGFGLLWWIRKRTDHKVKENRNTGFWMRVLCFGADLAVVDILILLLAFRVSLSVSGYLVILITVSYFFFFWMFFSTTPAGMVARMKVVNDGKGELKVWQILVRFCASLFLFIGWYTLLIDRKEKRLLHDLVSYTKVVYGDVKLVKKEKISNLLQFGLLGVVAVLMLSLFVVGAGERVTDYSLSSEVSFFDLNSDEMQDGLLIDLDLDGQVDIFKYDLDNDDFIDFSTFDLDSDGLAEGIDVNNDGRLDGFDFDNDNSLDVKVFVGQFFIWLWRVWFSILGIGLIVILVLLIGKEKGTFNA